MDHEIRLWSVFNFWTVKINSCWFLDGFRLPSIHQKKAILQNNKATKKSMALLLKQHSCHDPTLLHRADRDKVFAFFGYTDEGFYSHRQALANLAQGHKRRATCLFSL